MSPGPFFDLTCRRCFAPVGAPIKSNVRPFHLYLMLAKLLSALLAVSGTLLVFGGGVAIVQAEQSPPMVFAMLFAVVAFGVGCLIASIGVFSMRRYGFVLCIGLGISAAGFALIVSESVSQGVLWPIFAFMTASGAAGLFVQLRPSR